MPTLRPPRGMILIVIVVSFANIPVRKRESFHYLIKTFLRPKNWWSALLLASTDVICGHALWSVNWRLYF